VNRDQATQFAINVRADGGATVSVHDEPIPVTGYFVSDAGGIEIPLDAFTETDVRTFADKYAFELAHAGVFLGGWVSDGRVYLDITRHYFSRACALKAAEINQQLAIWDIANEAEIAA